jgi:hypothetical protein
LSGDNQNSGSKDEGDGDKKIDTLSERGDDSSSSKDSAVMIIVTIAVRKEALKMAMISYWNRSSAFSTKC